MEMKQQQKPATIDAYIAGFPIDVQEKLEIIRKAVKEAAPNASEAIKYAMPTFVLNGNLVSFAAWKNHIGFYPVPLQEDSFKAALSVYKSDKGTAKFPLNEPMPIELIKKIVVFWVKRNEEKALAKKKVNVKS